MSSQDKGICALCMLVTFVVGLLVGVWWGGNVVNDNWERSAKARGAMEYNKATGILEWKAELQRKDGR